MANKIAEIIIEPTKLYVGSSFRLKVKAIRYATYNELKPFNYNKVKKYTYNELKGD